MLGQVSSARFVGRAVQLAQLEEALAAAAGGEASAVLIGGEAGAGKTRLVQEAMARASHMGVQVLAGACVELSGGGLPYGPIVEALRRLRLDDPSAGVQEVLGTPDRELARLLSEVGSGDEELLGGAGAGLAQARLFEQLLGLLRQLGELAPLALVIEDLHGADRSTLDLLTFLLRSMRRERTLLVATYRSDELHSGHPLRATLADLDRSRRAERLNLPPFTRDELAKLLGGIRGSTPPDEMVERIFRRSEGNAFYAEELLAAGLGDQDTRLPPKLRDVVMVRIQALPEVTQEALRVVAAAGRDVSHRLVAMVSNLTPRRLEEALRHAADHYVLVASLNESTYSFRHTLVSEAVYDDLLPGERIRLHAAIADALAQDPGLFRGVPATLATQLAHHWLAAEEPARALAATVAAGRAAAGVHAFAEAQLQFERALILWDQVPDAEEHAGLDHSDLLARTAEVAHWTGRTEQALVLVRNALTVTDSARDPAQAGALQERLGRYLWEEGFTEDALAAYEEAIRLLSDAPASALHARFLAAQGAALTVRGKYRESQARCEQAIQLATRIGARAEEGFARNLLGVDLAMTGAPFAGIEQLKQARAIAEEVGSFEDICRAYANLSFVYENSGQLDEAAATALRGVELIRRIGLERTPPGGVLLTNAASQLLLLGQWPEADALLSDALEPENPGGLLGAYGLLYRAELRAARGQLDDARGDLENARRIAKALDEPQFFGPLHACLAEIAIWQGNHDAADRAAREGLMALAEREDDQLALRLCALGLRAAADQVERATLWRSTSDVHILRSTGVEWLARADDHAHKAHHGTPLPEIGAVSALCEAEFTRLQGRYDPKQWSAVAEAWADLRRPYQAVYARWRQAEALLALKVPRQATPVLREAWRTALKLQAEPLCQELRLLAHRGRVNLDEPAAQPKKEVGQPSPADRLGLTPREREVLRYLVEGRTNRQIARALFIQEKTASVHVSNILAKLGVANRGEAAAAAHRLRLVHERPVEDGARSNPSVGG